VNAFKAKYSKAALERYSQLRRKVLNRDGWRCQACGSASKLQIHHLQFRSALGHHAMDNLITLCDDCHKDLHANR
jgi:5-methylcytosine-specific restriction endonuclease McrA